MHLRHSGIGQIGRANTTSKTPSVASICASWSVSAVNHSSRQTLTPAFRSVSAAWAALPGSRADDFRLRLGSRDLGLQSVDPVDPVDLVLRVRVSLFSVPALLRSIGWACHLRRPETLATKSRLLDPQPGPRVPNSEFQWVERRGQDNVSARGQRPRSEPILLCISGPAFIWRLTGCVARMRRECKTTALPCSPPARGCIPLIEPQLGAGGACDTTRFILWG